MNKTLQKLFVIGVVTGVILMALVMVNGTISEREQYRNQAVKSIEESSAGPQMLIGPVLVRPYTQLWSLWGVAALAMQVVDRKAGTGGWGGLGLWVWRRGCWRFGG